MIYYPSKKRNERKLSMSFDGITTHAMVQELNRVLKNSRIEKIYVPNKTEILMTLHTQERNNVKLLISIDANHARIHLTNATRENPTTAPQFCMILRKYMQGGKILEITQQELDRVIWIRFENINDFGDYVQKTLIVELMGKYSNVILVDGDKMIDAMKHVTNVMSSVREVLPGKPYILPSSMGKQNFLATSSEAFVKLLDKESPIAASISNQFVGMSKTFVQGILQSLDIAEDATVANLSAEKVLAIYEAIHQVLISIEKGQFFVQWSDNHKDYWISAVESPTNSHSVTDVLASSPENALSNTHDALCSYTLDAFYTAKDQVSLLKTAKLNLARDVNTQLHRLQKKLAQSREVLKEQESLEMYREYGDLISSNIYRMQIGMEELTTENFYHNNAMVTIPLLRNRTPSQNAQQYFKKYAKLKKSITYALENQASYEKEISYLESVLFHLEEAQELKEVDEIREELVSSGILKKAGKRKKHQDIPLEPIRYEKEGIEILVGRNNLQNDRLTFKIARKTDTWLHTKNIHGSHVIIRSSEVSDSVLLYAAQLAAQHSQAKDTSRVEVDYTLVKFVHKEAGSKPGMVVYTDYHTIIV